METQSDMSRRTTHASSRKKKGGGKKSKGSKTGLVVGLSLAALAVIGVAIWLLTRSDGYVFQRADLDKYVEATHKENLLKDGASVYFDMSNGMNSAYATAESQQILQSVINKLGANQAIDFFGLSDMKITPITLPITDLYNYMLNPANYEKQKAPVEQTLAEISAKGQPALLMTDFEEYKGGVIEQAAYAKSYFIDWLAKGFGIWFYKWDFIENGKQKKMFIAVFDDNAQRLNSLVAEAVGSVKPDIATYVLAGHEYAFPIQTKYISLKQGGNYHNEKGVDAVTSVVENGGVNAYCSYAKPYASATGNPGEFAPLDTQVGAMAEFYPVGVNWNGAIANAKMMKDAGVPVNNRFTHLLRDLYVDFSSQSGFSIDNVEVRVFDMQKTMQAVAEKAGKINVETIEAIDKPEINMVLTAGMNDAADTPAGWKEIYVDFDPKFDGKFIGGLPSSDLLRANIVISKATPDLARAADFFGWDGNPSLANSVKEALQASTSSPAGRIIYTYYIKTISE